MALYSEAIDLLIPPGSNDPPIIPVGLVYHVRDGEGDSLFDYFSGPSGGVESTWYIRYDGTVEQYRDTLREADANYRGNSWTGPDGRRYGLHSVETEGLEHGEWTGAQITSLKQLTVWDASEHDWPLQVCPNWNRPGVGYHVMFGAPGAWTEVEKTCPGPQRVEQFDDIFVPWLESGGDMINADQIAEAVYQRELPRSMVDGEGLGLAVARLRRGVRRLELGQLDPAELADAIVAKLPPGSVDLATVRQGVREVLLEGVDE